MTAPDVQQEAERIQEIKRWAEDPTHLGGHAFNDLRWLLALLGSRDQRISHLEEAADIVLKAAPFGDGAWLSALSILMDARADRQANPVALSEEAEAAAWRQLHRMFPKYSDEEIRQSGGLQIDAFIEGFRVAAESRDQRIKELLPYVQHKPACGLLDEHAGSDRQRCTCGLASLLVEKEKP